MSERWGQVGMARMDSASAGSAVRTDRYGTGSLQEELVCREQPTVPYYAQGDMKGDMKLEILDRAIQSKVLSALDKSITNFLSASQ